MIAGTKTSNLTRFLNSEMGYWSEAVDCMYFAMDMAGRRRAGSKISRVCSGGLKKPWTELGRGNCPEIDRWNRHPEPSLGPCSHLGLCQSSIFDLLMFHDQLVIFIFSQCSLKHLRIFPALPYFTMLRITFCLSHYVALYKIMTLLCYMKGTLSLLYQALQTFE